MHSSDSHTTEFPAAAPRPPTKAAAANGATPEKATAALPVFAMAGIGAPLSKSLAAPIPTIPTMPTAPHGSHGNDSTATAAPLVVAAPDASAVSTAPARTADTKTAPLGTLLALEAGCAVVSASLVAPLISIVDKAIFANASGQQPLLQGVVAGLTTLATRPLYFVRQPSFLLILGVYGGTYIVANTTQALCDRRGVPWQLPKFITSSVANVGLSVLKDLYFTRAFGSGPARPVAPSSYALYTARDSMTIYASFNMPAVVAERLATSTGMSHKSAETLAQLATPCAVQLMSSPLHLLGMDLYNRPSATATAASKPITWGDRMAFIRREYAVTTAARIGRIFPAFGIGGVANKYLRSKAHAWLENRSSDKSISH